MEKNEMIFGIRAVIEAVEAGKEIDKILIKKDLQGDLAKELFDLIKGRGFFVQRVPVERLNRITRKNHQGVIAFISAVSTSTVSPFSSLVSSGTRRPFTRAPMVRWPTSVCTA